MQWLHCLIWAGVLLENERDGRRIVGAALPGRFDGFDQFGHRVMLKQCYDPHESFAGICGIVLDVSIEQRPECLVEASMTKDFRADHGAVLEREQVDKMHRVQYCLVFSEDSLVLGNLDGVDNDANAVDWRFLSAETHKAFNALPVQ